MSSSSMAGAGACARSGEAQSNAAVEMEAAMLYTLGAMHGIETLTVCTISDLITDEQTAERISDEELRVGVDRMMQVACEVAAGR